MSTAFKSYREECIDARSAREGILDQRPIGSRNKRARPVVIESRLVNDSRDPLLKQLFPNDWERHGAYRTATEADAMIAQFHHKHPNSKEFRRRI